ncbi:MAG: beta-galactosidase [Clostridia bacterium]|nr:beta-galactosidase [Clostridia bacterium]
MPELNLSFFGHGGDYNPDQWRDTPGILDEDIRLLKKAGCNLMSVGIFSWAALEPQEGVYDFGWLQEVLDKFAENGISAFLATPSGARPAWMSEKYPEVLRVRGDGIRNHHGVRHNHCFTSPVYREFVRKINTALAERFGHHPAVVGWHVSNEYSGECHCELCQAAFRDFLKDTYGTLDALNHAWWTGFWAKTYTDWSQLRSPMDIGETHIHGLNLSWKRFVTHQTLDFLKAEIEPLRRLTPHLPVTTNLMQLHDGLDYFRFGDVLDFVSYDSYPAWGRQDDEDAALLAAFNYDMMRCICHKPFALMESTPSQVNWQDVCKLKKPGMHLLSSLHAVAHGADTVQYFQWRKSRGSSEKLHGAVVDHVGHEHTRVFREVTEVGQWLQKLQPVLGSMPSRQAALIYDLENRWAQDNAQGPRKDKQYMAALMGHYGALKRAGLCVDVIDETMPFDGYGLIVAPQMYLVKPGVADRLKAFAKAGGTVVTTYFSGIVDENDLCALGGWPGDMMDLFGVWAEEIDPLFPGKTNAVIVGEGQRLGAGRYSCDFMCDVIHARDAEVIGTYESDYYAGMPAVTRNAYGDGAAWYLASRMDREFLAQLYAKIAAEAGMTPAVANLPYGVHADVREKDGARFLFLQNYAAEPKSLSVPEGRDAITGEAVGGEITLPVHGIRIIRCA